MALKMQIFVYLTSKETTKKLPLVIFYQAPVTSSKYSLTPTHP